MSTRGAYRIVDDPAPSGLVAVAVNPFWPLLSMMLCGAWLALPWFAVNGLAHGSPTRRREIGLVVAGAIGAVAIAFPLIAAYEAGLIYRSAVPYAVIVLVVWKLAIAYALFMPQSRALQLHEHYGGRVRNGAFVLVAGLLLLRGRVLGLYDDYLWLLLVS